MRKYQIWKSKEFYAISDYDSSVIHFATHKNFSLKYKKHSTIDTESATKPAFIKFLTPLITNHGVHPIFNSKGESCEQIVNVPNWVMTSDEILIYLNNYTILPQETPPWEEIIFKLVCYSEVLTEEYFDRMEVTLPKTEEEILDRSEDDVDAHYFVSVPKLFEGKKGTVFHLPKPNRAHRKWVILEEYYDHKKNAWVSEDETCKRTGKIIDLIDNKKEIDQNEIERAKQDFINSGHKIETKEPEEFDWQSLEIHPLAIKIPAASGTDRERLRKDIILHGVHESIKLYQGKVLDGRTRQELSVEEGIKPPYESWKGKCTPKEYVESLNLKRRHLTASQLAAYGVENLLEKYEKEALKRTKINAAKNFSNSNQELIPDSQKGTSRDLLADFLEINPRYISDAKNIKVKSPELFKKVFDGELTITKAKKELIPTKKRKNCKFEKKYREFLKVLAERELTLKDYYTPSIKLSKIYLEWDKRNDVKMIKKLEELKKEFPVAFGERHLTLLRM